MELVEREQSCNHYQELCQAMEPGLLISLNNGENTSASASGELEVLLVDKDTGEVELKGPDGEMYRIRHDHPSPAQEVPIYEPIQRELRPTPVETIEIIGAVPP